ERKDSDIEIIVSDTGVGIRSEFLPHVFERFRQADAGLKGNGAGLGLGLSIVLHIVEMHGGSVHVASDGEGRGSTFRVRLPLMVMKDSEVREGIRGMAVDDADDARLRGASGETG
ncbi:MAG TPA: ATP-binding protein, partial [Vicinamibacterales bacterium]|nr:ATP-binding protein [Vicinamibacterales bacterium]